MASAARRARRAQKPINMTLESIVGDLNAATSKLDNYIQQTAGSEDANPAVTARLTQGVVLAGTAIEILSGLVNALNVAERIVENEQSEETTEE